jgi:hypothetical protein
VAQHSFTIIRCVDISGGQTGGLGPSVGYIPGCAKPFYGTMVGPWWYHTATIVPWVRDPPFSLLRMLILPGCRGECRGRQGKSRNRESRKQKGAARGKR